MGKFRTSLLSLETVLVPDVVDDSDTILGLSSILAPTRFRIIGGKREFEELPRLRRQCTFYGSNCPQLSVGLNTLLISEVLTHMRTPRPKKAGYASKAKRVPDIVAAVSYPASTIDNASKANEMERYSPNYGKKPRFRISPCGKVRERFHPIPMIPFQNVQRNLDLLQIRAVQPKLEYLLASPIVRQGPRSGGADNRGQGVVRSAAITGKSQQPSEQESARTKNLGGDGRFVSGGHAMTFVMYQIGTLFGIVGILIRRHVANVVQHNHAGVNCATVVKIDRPSGPKCSHGHECYIALGPT
ncbi:hypothetical protein C8R45DRAFT_919372 [Mycena sanguinolenta]|nr:hypothetical protein C8R45DRAFT_919372 [Mycena sanguinolenta]